MAEIETGIQEVDPRHQLDVDSLASFLRGRLEGFEGPLRVRQFKGGQSNPTYHLGDGSREWVLRRKPPGQLVSSAHAIDREYRVLRALMQVDFPSPRPRLYCEDEGVIGSEFYVMDRVEGRILVDQTLPGWTPEDRRSLYASQLEILARLHAIDPAAIGLADYGKPGSYFARQIHVWSKQYERSEVERSPAMERLMAWLPENVPSDDETAIVHGDYGLNNMVVDPRQARVRAILDWELSTIGHPLADLTYHLAQRLTPGGHFASLDPSELPALGIPTQQEMVDRYCELTGREGIQDLDFYLAFHLFRMAGILFGIAGRAKVGTAAGSEAFEIGRTAPVLAERGLQLAARLGA